MGDSTAQCQLGICMRDGFFGEPDAQGKQSAGTANRPTNVLPHGQFRLGACYQLGKGVEQDWEEAARLFELAARRGHPEAAECLELLARQEVGWRFRLMLCGTRLWPNSIWGWLMLSGEARWTVLKLNREGRPLRGPDLTAGVTGAAEQSEEGQCAKAGGQTLPQV